MWTCPTIWGTTTYLYVAVPHNHIWSYRFAISLFRIWNGHEGGSQKYESTWWCFVKSKKKIIFCMFDELFPTFLETRGIMAWQLGWMTFQWYPRLHVIKWTTKIQIWLNIWISCTILLKILINYIYDVKHLHLEIYVTFTWPLKVIQFRHPKINWHAIYMIYDILILQNIWPCLVIQKYCCILLHHVIVFDIHNAIHDPKIRLVLNVFWSSFSRLERPIWIFVIFGQISQKWCMSWLMFLWKTYTKSYVIFKSTSWHLTLNDL